MNKKTLGQFIAELRKEKNLTQRQLAEIIGVSDKTISHWERDESSPDISVLLHLADTFEITVDELLKGKRTEKNSSSSACDFVIQSESEKKMKSKEKEKESIDSRFRRYKLLSLIGTGFGIYALFYLLFYMATFQNAMSVASGFIAFAPILSVLKPLAVSLFATIGFRIYFSGTFIPTDESTEQEVRSIYKANRIFILNLYLLCITLVIGIIPALDFIPYITLYIASAVLVVVGIIVCESLLKAKGFLKGIKNKKLFRLQLFTIIISAIFILAGGAFQAFINVYTPTPKSIVFTDAYEFKAYMETPKDKPENAYMIDGVEATMVTEPPTTAAVTADQRTDITESPVSAPPSAESTESPTDNYRTLFNRENGDAIITFNFLNGEVAEYWYDTENKTFNVVTYTEAIRVSNWGGVQDRTGMIVPLYCVAVIVISFIIYIKKAKKYKRSE